MQAEKDPIPNLLHVVNGLMEGLTEVFKIVILGLFQTLK
jgi:hypothetical protein